jgi:SAM-dependent methyltransferase
LAIQQEFSTFRDALDGRSAGVQETGESGRIFVIRRQQDSGAVTTLAYNTALFPSFYDAMVASLPPEFEVLESQTFYSTLALAAAPETGVDVKVLDLFTGTGRVPRCVAAAWSTRAGKCRSCGKCRSLRITAVDNSEEMLKSARRKWMEFPSVEIEWQLGALGQPGALADLHDMDLALVSDGSFHLLPTRQEQLVAVTEIKNALKPNGLLILNLFAVDELVHDEFSLGDHGGLDIWHMKHGYWKQVRARHPSSVM